MIYKKNKRKRLKLLIKKMPKTVHKLKDNAYKLIFAEPEMFLDFLKNFIPIDILKKVKPQDIEDITERFLPLFSDNKDSDTIKKIRLEGNKPLFVIGIIEHESEVNYTTTVKMLQYITLVLTDYIKENDKKHKEEMDKKHRTKIKLSTSKGFKLPPVLPIVFYDGTKKWTSSLNLIDRTELSEIFEKYIPKFEYELVDLNKYSRDDLIKFGNLLSLMLIVDKVHKVEDFELLNTLPKEYLDKLKLNIPDHLLELLANCIRLFLIKAEVREEKIDEITEILYQRRFNDMFDVQVSIKNIEEEAARKAVKKNTIELAKKLLKNGIPLKIVSDSTGLDEGFLKQLNLETE
jgi:predicted transposase/invertase (TIGR01784 family)